MSFPAYDDFHEASGHAPPKTLNTQRQRPSDNERETTADNSAGRVVSAFQKCFGGDPQRRSIPFPLPDAPTEASVRTASDLEVDPSGGGKQTTMVRREIQCCRSCPQEREVVINQLAQKNNVQMRYHSRGMTSSLKSAAMNRLSFQLPASPHL